MAKSLFSLYRRKRKTWVFKKPLFSVIQNAFTCGRKARTNRKSCIFKNTRLCSLTNAQLLHDPQRCGEVLRLPVVYRKQAKSKVCVYICSNACIFKPSSNKPQSEADQQIVMWDHGWFSMLEIDKSKKQFPVACTETDGLFQVTHFVTSLFNLNKTTHQAT